VALARKLCMKYRVRAPEIKRKACKKCGAFWIPGYNLTVRVRSRGKIVEYLCACGSVARFPFGRERKG